MNATEVLEDILQKLDSPEGREFAQTFSSPILAWGAGMAVGVAKAIEEMQPILDAKQAEIDALKAQNAELLAAQEGTPCNHKFNAAVGGVLSCIHCYASFSEQQEAKARGDL